MLLLVVGFPLTQTLLLGAYMPKSITEALEGRFWADYGTLYDFYRPRLFLWGSITEVRKLLLLGLIIAVQPRGPAPQALALESGLLLLVFAQLWVLPLRRKRMNMLQVAMLCAVLQTVHLGVLLPLLIPKALKHALWPLQTVAVVLDVLLFVILGGWIVAIAAASLGKLWPGVKKWLLNRKQQCSSRACCLGSKRSSTV
jgi:hypothetical protein